MHIIKFFFWLLFRALIITLSIALFISIVMIILPINMLSEFTIPVIVNILRICIGISIIVAIIGTGICSNNDFNKFHPNHIKYKIGDLVKYKNNPHATYQITSINYGTETTWGQYLLSNSQWVCGRYIVVVNQLKKNNKKQLFGEIKNHFKK